MHNAHRGQLALPPVASAERIVSIDVTRGAALAGVLLVNLLTHFHTAFRQHPGVAPLVRPLRRDDKSSTWICKPYPVTRESPPPIL